MPKKSKPKGIGRKAKQPATLPPEMPAEEITPGPRGRPLTYTPEIAAEICGRLATGESLRAICRADHMPPESTVRLWVIDDHNGFAAQYARARDLGLDSMADENFEIADDGSNDWMEKRNADGALIGWTLNGEHVQRSKLRVEYRKWYLSKLAPKKYGERLAVDHGAQDSLSDLMKAIDGKSRGLPGAD